MFTGLFYPADPNELKGQIRSFLEKAKIENIEFDPDKIRAVIVPHAGYVYSGQTAGYVYKAIGLSKTNKFVLLGLSHQYAFQGIAKCSADVWETSLGEIAVDKDLNTKFFIPTIDSAYKEEHSIEVQLPFLKFIKNDASILPIIAGEIEDLEKTTQIFYEKLEKDTILIVSSDLSHYHEYNHAIAKDKQTLEKIMNLTAAIELDEACGSASINVLLGLAKLKKWKAIVLDYRNSGDTAGDKDQVVGYCAILFLEN